MGKRKTRIMICVITGICLTAAGAIVYTVVSKRNPLAKGLLGLSEEITAMQEELGEYFWADAVNQIGSENIQAEYSLNIGKMEPLKNITVGLDGELERNMEQKLFGAEAVLSVANVEIAETSLFGTADALCLQMPSVWEGSVVLDTEDISGQWNTSAVKSGLELLAGQEFSMERRVDVNFFKDFYVNRYWLDDFFQKNGERLRSLYENMEVVKLKQAQKRGLLDTGQAESLENHILEDAEGNRIMTTCYLVILPVRELEEIFEDVEVDIKLCVYLDSKKRIVRICTLPGERLEAGFWEGEATLDLTGAAAVTDRMTFEADGTADLSGLWPALSGGQTDFSAEPGVKGCIIIEKNREETGSYQVECEGSLTDRENRRELSLEGRVQGRRSEKGKEVFLEVDRLVIKSQEETICRGSGRAKFMPLVKEVEMPSGKEHRIGEMGELDAALFLAECMKNIHENYGGYLKFIQ